jgi:hypothetical protein
MRIVYYIALCLACFLTVAAAASQTSMTIVPQSRIHQAYEAYLDAWAVWQSVTHDLEDRILQEDPKRALDRIRRSQEAAEQVYDKRDKYWRLFAEMMRNSFGLSGRLRDPRAHEQAKQVVLEGTKWLNEREKSLRAGRPIRQADPIVGLLQQDRDQRELELISRMRLNLYEKGTALQEMEQYQDSGQDLTSGTAKLLEDIRLQQALSQEARSLRQDYDHSLERLVLENQRKKVEMKKSRSDPKKIDASGTDTSDSQKQPLESKRGPGGE